MLVGALDPLEGSLVIVPGAGLAALGAFLGHSRRRVFSYWAVVLVVVGVAAMFGVSAVGGLGEGTGRSLWWAVPLVVTYAAGWVLGLIGAVSAVIEFFPVPRAGFTAHEPDEALPPPAPARWRAEQAPAPIDEQACLPMSRTSPSVGGEGSHQQSTTMSMPHRSDAPQTQHTGLARRLMRRAWWSLLLVPVAFVVAVVLGEWLRAGIYPAVIGMVFAVLTNTLLLLLRRS